MSKIVIYEVGKTDDKYLVEGIDKYLKRLKHYVKLEIQTIKESRQKLATLKTQEESSQIFSKISNNDYVILLDEHGKELSSVEFAAFIEDMNLNNPNNLLFIIGGAYGHSDHL
ncbi:MAG TPA: 23S rRNA (pseudouridine(1915)-N(3))-methyltransferase RlmH, partial [Saprospiraceae bacterium]|nr:23S rRNA (pseudouridine(1915)-N(3))-methyltransferase RlmH [Saprospiraceae bacterium]